VHEGCGSARGSTAGPRIHDGCVHGFERARRRSLVIEPGHRVSGDDRRGAAEAGLAVVPSVAARVEPSVVTILTGEGTGSGVVLGADGVIVTNEHVVRGNTAVQVAFADGQRVNGTVRATDPISDVAVVQSDRRDLPPPASSRPCPRWGAWRW
jgi:serine protease DegQ